MAFMRAKSVILNVIDDTPHDPDMIGASVFIK